MKDMIETLFGSGEHLNALQMSCRAFVIFLISLLLIRISGRRSFGIRTALDNIIVILLGALLSKAITGTAPFWPVVAASFVLVVFHRGLAWLMVRHRRLSEMVEGPKICLYDNEKFIDKNLGRALVCEEDVLQGVRKSALTDDLSKVRTVYLERNGEISAVKKDPG